MIVNCAEFRQVVDANAPSLAQRLGRLTVSDGRMQVLIVFIARDELYFLEYD